MSTQRYQCINGIVPTVDTRVHVRRSIRANVACFDAATNRLSRLQQVTCRQRRQRHHTAITTCSIQRRRCASKHFNLLEKIWISIHRGFHPYALSIVLTGTIQQQGDGCALHTTNGWNECIYTRAASHFNVRHALDDRKYCLRLSFSQTLFPCDADRCGRSIHRVRCFSCNNRYRLKRCHCVCLRKDT